MSKCLIQVLNFFFYRLSLDASTVPFRQNMTDRISGSLDDILAYEDMQSVRSSYASQSAVMGKLQFNTV